MGVLVGVGAFARQVLPHRINQRARADGAAESRLTEDDPRLASVVLQGTG